MIEVSLGHVKDVESIHIPGSVGDGHEIRLGANHVHKVPNFNVFDVVRSTGQTKNKKANKEPKVVHLETLAQLLS